jgi:serine phosphatase RsbU (regulator of sigma subunit)
LHLLGYSDTKDLGGAERANNRISDKTPTKIVSALFLTGISGTSSGEPMQPRCEGLIQAVPALWASEGLVIRRKRGWRLPRLRWSRALLTVPFLIIMAVGISRLLAGPGHGLEPLLAVGPAAAAALGGVTYTLAAGVAALAVEMLFVIGLLTTTQAQQAEVGFAAVLGVTVSGALAANIRRRRERELSDVRTIADVTQRVLLRPLPGQVGQVRLAGQYLSASSRARIGGDLYAAVATASGDAEGKGLSAVQQAATAMGVFREAAYEERTLSAVAARIESMLGREMSEEQFITAILAEANYEGSKIEMINCGHPQPLQIGPEGPHLLGPADGGLPLGFSALATAERIPFTVSLRAGEPVLFYTDGLSEARNRAGNFFALTRCAAVQTPTDPHTLLERLSAEVGQHVSHQPHDDIAMLAIRRQPLLGPGRLIRSE